MYIVLFCLFFLSSAYADEEIWQDHGEVKSKILYSGPIEENNSILGIELKILKGWHIYYKDPGDVGLPTSFDIKSSNIQNYKVAWPKPLKNKSKVAGQIFNSNIYKDYVLFPIHISLVDNKLPLKSTITIKLAICKETCVPKTIKINTYHQNLYNSEHHKQIQK